MRSPNLVGSATNRPASYEPGEAAALDLARFLRSLHVAAPPDAPANPFRGVPLQARAAFDLARTVSEHVIIEKFIKGFDFRFLVVNYKLIAVAKRSPAMIIGDGFSTIRQLVEEVNSDPRRGEGHENVLTAKKNAWLTLPVFAS